MKKVSLLLLCLSLCCFAWDDSAIKILKAKGKYATILNDNFKINDNFYVISDDIVVGKCKIILTEKNLAIVRLDADSEIETFDLKNTLIHPQESALTAAPSISSKYAFFSLAFGLREISLNELKDNLILLESIDKNIVIDELNSPFFYNADFGGVHTNLYYFLTLTYYYDLFGFNYNASEGTFYEDYDLKIIDLIGNFGVNFKISDKANFLLAIGMGTSYISLNADGEIVDYESGDIIQIESELKKWSFIKKPFCAIEFNINNKSKISLKLGYRIINFGKIKGTYFIDGIKGNEYALNSEGSPMNFDNSGFFGSLGISFLIF